MNVKIKMQISNMKHALGYDASKVRENQYTPYRNYFALSGEDENWEDLVNQGYAKKRVTLGSVVYFVSDQGRDFLSEILGVVILPESR